jgi:hypothetical protein
MSKLVWDQFDQRKYEAGVDRGVLYPESGSGVVWNGLINIEESFIGGEVNPYYFDGIKFVDLVSPKNFQATLTAFSAPEEFSPCIGDKSVVPGFVLTRQQRAQFSLSYRTLIGQDKGYKLHLVYNATASVNGRSRQTIGSEVPPETLSWQIDAVPVASSSYRPSGHFIFDSTETDPEALSIIEKILYGTLTSEPRLPGIEEILDLTVIGESLTIMPEETTGLAELVSGSGDIYMTSVAGIHRALPDTRLYETSIRGLYRLG